MRHWFLFHWWPSEVGWPTNIGFLVAFQQSLLRTNHWPSWNGHIIVGWIVTSPINSRTHFSVKQSREEGVSGFKNREWTQHSATGSCCHALHCNTQLPSRLRLPWRLFHWRCRQHVCGRADLDLVQKECPSHADLLERLLQLWTLHCLPRTYNFGPAVSNRLKPQSDNVGVFRPAVLPVDWQLDRRRFQEDVRIQFACRLAYHPKSRWITWSHSKWLYLLSFSKAVQCPCCFVCLRSCHLCHICHHPSVHQCSPACDRHGCFRTGNGDHWYHC